MIRDITIGQYYPADSVIHKLDPRVKLAGTLLFIISLFLFSSFTGYIIAAIFLFSIIFLSKVPVKFILRGLKSIFVLLFLTVFFNLVLTPGKVVLELPGPFQITMEGIRLSTFMAIRLVFLIMGSSVMTLTTTPNQLTDGLEKGLAPLKKLGVPVHEISMMMSIALRFIPILLEETDKIMKAQEARGADFKSGNIIQRAKSMIPILVPLFVSAFRRANDLALAMEARCYNGGEGRTKMKPLKYTCRDRVAYLITIIYLMILIGVNILAKKYLPF
jgi:energy-coupling factor transport system permease protein